LHDKHFYPNQYNNLTLLSRQIYSLCLAELPPESENEPTKNYGLLPWASAAGDKGAEPPLLPGFSYMVQM